MRLDDYERERERFVRAYECQESRFRHNRDVAGMSAEDLFSEAVADHLERGVPLEEVPVEALWFFAQRNGIDARRKQDRHQRSHTWLALKAAEMNRRAETKDKPLYTNPLLGAWFLAAAVASLTLSQLGVRLLWAAAFYVALIVLCNVVVWRQKVGRTRSQAWRR